MHDCSKESRSTSACLWFAKSCELKLRNVPHFQGKELWHWEMPQDMGQPSDVARIIRKGENWIVKSFFDLPSTDFMNITPFQREVVAAVGVFTCRLLWFYVGTYRKRTSILDQSGKSIDLIAIVLEEKGRIVLFDPSDHSVVPEPAYELPDTSERCGQTKISAHPSILSELVNSGPSICFVLSISR